MLCHAQALETARGLVIHRINAAFGALVCALLLGLAGGSAAALDITEPSDFGDRTARRGGEVHVLDPGTNVFEGRLQGAEPSALDKDVINFALDTADRIEEIRVDYLGGTVEGFEALAIDLRLSSDHGPLFNERAEPFDALIEAQDEPVRTDFTPQALADFAAETGAPDAYLRIGFGEGSGRLPIAYDVAYRLVIVVAQ